MATDPFVNICPFCIQVVQDGDLSLYQKAFQLDETTWVHPYRLGAGNNDKEPRPCLASVYRVAAQANTNVADMRRAEQQAEFVAHDSVTE